MSNEQGKRSVPKWAAETFKECLDRNERLTQVLHMSMAGIRMLQGRHEAVKLLAELDGKLKDRDVESELKRAEAEKALAQREVDHGFPVLHEQATIALWSSLEALVRSFLARWVEHNREAWQCDAIKKLRVKLGDYESLEHQDRCLWIVDLIDQELNGPLRSGITRFECLLQPFGLAGPVDEQCQRILYELSQVRNGLVHRSGIADRKLLEACPWLGVSAGQPLIVTHEMWSRYNRALADYVLELIQRVRVHFGVGRYVKVPDDDRQSGERSVGEGKELIPSAEPADMPPAGRGKGPNTGE